MTARIPDRFPTAEILIEAESLSVTRRGKEILSNAGVRVRAGEIVTLIGRQDEESIELPELAIHANTIPWEILCSVTKRVPRLYKTTRE